MSGDLMNPPDGEVAHTIAATGDGRVALNLSTRFDEDPDEVAVIGIEMSRLAALMVAARIVREAVRR